ncbi:MAG: Gfo/Idh/MocA family oxidoreductase [Desulfobulbaceae bacterium]|nr:Gfo/Idh/MocA family oxidoreductase [Desulfobulbaceae bacterium]
MKIGIIGTGKHGSRYARHILHDVAGLELCAISRRSSSGAQQAREWGIHYHAEWQNLIADPEVDAVIAVTPPVLNVDIARCCAQAGKPLLLEKPLAVDSQAAAEIVSLFKEKSLPLTVGQILRYNSTILALQKSLNRVGTLYSFSASHRLEPSTLPWLEDPSVAGAGVILHTAVHMFDALHFITGYRISRVRASLRQIHNANLENLFTAQVEMENGVIGTVDAAKVGPARTGRYEFVGHDGELQGDQIHGKLEFISGTTIEPIAHEFPAGTIVPLLRDWLLFLQGQAGNPISGEEGLAAVNVCTACLDSARNNDWVKVDY